MQLGNIVSVENVVDVELPETSIADVKTVEETTVSDSVNA